MYRTTATLQEDAGSWGSWIGMQQFRNWDHHNIPKHCFIGWLAMKNILQTSVRLASIGVSNINTCLLCEANVEDYTHLFFNC